jgi:ankyrin repeat protein
LGLVRDDDREGNKFLIDAERGDAEGVKRCLAAGVPLDLTRTDKNTALHWAAKNGHTDVMRLLLEQGAPINSQNDWGATPLYLAAADGGTAAARILLEHGADPSIRISGTRATPLQVARVKNPANQELQALLETADKNPSQRLSKDGPVFRGR